MKLFLGFNDPARLRRGLIPKETSGLLHIAKTQFARSDFRLNPCRSLCGKILQKPHGSDASPGLALAVLKLSHGVIKKTAIPKIREQTTSLNLPQVMKNAHQQIAFGLNDLPHLSKQIISANHYSKIFCHSRFDKNRLKITNEISQIDTVKFRPPRSVASKHTLP